MIATHKILSHIYFFEEKPRFFLKKIAADRGVYFRLLLRFSFLVMMFSALLPVTVYGDSLRDTLGTAIFSHPAIKADEERQKVTKAGVAKARAGFLPIITGSIDAGYGDDNFHTNEKIDPESTQTYRMTVTQPVFNGLRSVNDMRRARSEAKAGKSILEETRQRVVLETAFAYLSVIRDRRVRSLRKDNITNLGKILRSSKMRFRGGETTRTDIAQAQARLENAHADYERSVSDLTKSKANFKRHVGHAPRRRLSRPAPVKRHLPKSLQSTIDLAVQQNPRLQSSLLQERAARFAKNSAIGALLPAVNLDASYLRERSSQKNFNDHDEFEVAVRVSVPIFSGGAKYADVSAARATERQKNYEAIDTRRDVVRLAKSAWSDYQSARRRIKAYHAQIKAATAAARGVRLEAKVGERTVDDVLRSEQDVIDAKIANEIALYDRDSAAFTMLAVTGRLTQDVINN